jgi:hypothetical protein
MRKLLGISTAVLVGLMMPTAFASPIPSLTSQGLVMDGTDFSFGAETTGQITDTSTQTAQSINGGAIANYTTFSLPDSTGNANEAEIFSPPTNTPLVGLGSDAVQTDANSIPLNLESADPPASVPEPSSFLLLGAALAGAGLFARRRTTSR